MHKTTIGLTFLYLEPWGGEASRTAGDETVFWRTILPPVQ